MKHAFILILALLFSLLAQGQSNASIEKMRRERAQMEEQIAMQEKILTSTESSISSQVSNLNILTARLKERTRLLNETRSQVRQLERESQRLDNEIAALESDLEKCRQAYADACRFYQNQNASFNPLTFIVSAKTFSQMNRRIRYVSEYSVSLREMADEITQKKDTIEHRRSEVEAMRLEKVELQKVQQANEEAAKKEEKQQKSIVSQLKNKRSSLKKEIAAKQKQMTALSKEIERQIQLAIKEEQAEKKSSRPAQEDIRLTGSFESNKGKLPIPVTSAYIVVGEYGVQNVAGMKDVKQNNLGIDIQGEKGATARAVFDGTVSSIFQQGKGQIGVLIRHGSYISVYCNLSDTRLKKGDKVKTGDIIGNIQVSENGMPVLHFQLHKESSRLNPSDWLRR